MTTQAMLVVSIKLGRRDSAASPALEHATGCKSATLIVGESETSAAELLFEDAVLFDEVGDDLGLLTIDPAGEGSEEELKRKEVGHHARSSA